MPFSHLRSTPLSLPHCSTRQAFITSGESGADKIESMKVICRDLANLKNELYNVLPTST